jgi:DNA invertase Pin-like site-specific DNA recombinase
VEAIRRLAAANKLELGEIVQELDVSGGRDIDDRRLGALVRAVESGESAGILVWRLSRFSRNLLDGVTVADRVTRAGGRLLATDFDSSQPMSKAILGLLLGFAEEERVAKQEGWRIAEERAIARGIHLSKAPRGYLKSTDGTLAVDPDQVEIVSAAFQARARGASLTECADLLGMSRTGVRRLLKSTTYLGHVRKGTMLHSNAHEPLVSERIWQLAQYEGEPPERSGRFSSQGVLAGLVLCASCGFVCSVAGSSLSQSHVLSYSCRGRRASNVCTARAAAGVAKLDNYVWPLLRERAGTVDLEAALGEWYESQVSWTAADRELRDFLAGASISNLGPDLYAQEVTRRREALRDATEAYRVALDSQEALIDSDSLQGRRELAKRLLAGVTLHKATRGRYDPIESRAELHWR